MSGDDEVVFLEKVIKVERDADGYEDCYGKNSWDDSYDVESLDYLDTYSSLDAYRHRINKREGKVKLLGVKHRMSMLISKITAFVESGGDSSLEKDYSLDDIDAGAAASLGPFPGDDCTFCCEDVSDEYLDAILSKGNHNKNRADGENSFNDLPHLTDSVSHYGTPGDTTVTDLQFEKEIASEANVQLSACNATNLQYPGSNKRREYCSQNPSLKECEDVAASPAAVFVRLAQSIRSDSSGKTKKTRTPADKVKEAGKEYPDQSCRGKLGRTGDHDGKTHGAVCCSMVPRNNKDNSAQGSEKSLAPKLKRVSLGTRKLTSLPQSVPQERKDRKRKRREENPPLSMSLRSSSKPTTEQSGNEIASPCRSMSEFISSAIVSMSSRSVTETSLAASARAEKQRLKSASRKLDHNLDQTALTASILVAKEAARNHRQHSSDIRGNQQALILEVSKTKANNNAAEKVGGWMRKNKINWGVSPFSTSVPKATETAETLSRTKISVQSIDSASPILSACESQLSQVSFDSKKSLDTSQCSFLTGGRKRTKICW